MIPRRRVLPVLAVLAVLAAGCDNEPERLQAEARLVDQGKEVFRFDTFGDEVFWTDTLRLHEVVGSAVDPVTALSVGLKVDADALPPGILETADLAVPRPRSPSSSSTRWWGSRAPSRPSTDATR